MRAQTLHIFHQFNPSRTFIIERTTPKEISTPLVPISQKLPDSHHIQILDFFQNRGAQPRPDKINMDSIGNASPYTRCVVSHLTPGPQPPKFSTIFFLTKAQVNGGSNSHSLYRAKIFNLTSSSKRRE